jgi:O-antigen/teichoic acid export membrane protein
MARREGHEPEVTTLSAALRYVLVLDALFVAPIVIWAHPIVDLILGSGYGRSGTLLRELAPYVFLSGLSPLVGTTANYLGAGRQRIPVALLDLVLSAGLTAGLVAAMDLDGAALASDFAPIPYVGLHLWIIRKYVDLPLRPLLLAAVRGLLAAAAMAGVLALFGTAHLSVLDWFAGGTLGTAAFVAVIVATGEVTLDELRRAPREIRRRVARGRGQQA